MIAPIDGGSLMLSPQERSSIIRFITDMDGDDSEFVTTAGRQAPKELNTVINRVLRAIAQDLPISITTMPRELTTTTAAAALRVSRPTLMKYIREGRIQAHKVGTHHRLKAGDVFELAERLKEEQRQAVLEIMDMAPEDD